MSTPTPGELQGLFVTGTDTGVGKTAIAAWITRALSAAGQNVGIYKPACSGAELTDAGVWTWPDIDRLSAALGGRYPAERICPQKFRAAAAPPVAAQYEGASVDEDLLLAGVRWWQGRVDWLIVEGVGGWLSPISETASCADLADALGFPVLLVAGGGLGTINHTLLTVDAILSRGLTVAGVVVNHHTDAGGDDLSRGSNASEIGRRSRAPILAEVPHQPVLDLPLPAEVSKMDWSLLMRPMRSL